MKWTKKTQAYMWAKYYSEDGRWLVYDRDVTIKGGSNRKAYNPDTKRFERMDVVKHVWYLEEVGSGERVGGEFKTMKAAKEFAENHTA